MIPLYINTVFALATVCVARDAQESRTVQTAQGPVRGYNTDGVYHFYGIPYATAPTGTRRFTAPLAGPKWMSRFEAVNNKIVCPQGKTPWLDYYMLEMKEDCLVANVYMPDTENNNLPVVVYVHGGGYQLLYGEKERPTALVRTKKVVAVTFNYRLGVHGFLCLGTENIPGNAGMKDQVALLRWVQENIANFGGNPSDVTIAGYSAGASSVELLMLSEMSEGLYSKVIPESGSSITPWSVQIDPVQNAKYFARQLNFTNIDDIGALDDFYSTLSLEAMTSDTFPEMMDSTFVFSPCVETETGVERFLKDTPVNILTSGHFTKVPILYGFSSMEGFIRAPQFEQWKDKMNETFSLFLPADLQFVSKEERESISHEIRKFYFGNKPISVETVQGYIDYFSDIMFVYPALRSVTLQVKAGSQSIYLYEYTFNHLDSLGIGLPKSMTDIIGAGHCAETFAVLEGNNNHGHDSDEFKKMKEVMVKIWVNFITTGKPVPDESDLPSWPPVGTNMSPHMELGEKIRLKGPLLEERVLFWDNIYDRFYRSPSIAVSSLSKS